MKSLLLMRHGQAVTPGATEDHERPLTDEGIEDAWAMGLHMASMNLLPDAVLVSSAQRAQETFSRWNEKALFHGRTTTEAGLYLAARSALLTRIARLSENIERALIIGHNPGLSSLASVLSDSPVHMGTLQLVHLTSDLDTWQDAEAAGAWTLAGSITRGDI